MTSCNMEERVARALYAEAQAEAKAIRPDIPLPSYEEDDEDSRAFCHRMAAAAIATINSTPDSKCPQCGWLPGYHEDECPLTPDSNALRAEILRLTDALSFAHSEGFEWPVDPLPFGSIAHDLFIERGNEREAQRSGPTS